MTPKEIDDFIMQCPYFGGKNTIDRKIIDGELVHIGDCGLEFHYRKICPSAQCVCAKKMGLQGADHIKTAKAKIIMNGKCCVCGKPLDNGLFLCEKCAAHTEADRG